MIKRKSKTTMDSYAIYCTEEQTKKALELGAKIEIQEYCPPGEIEPNWFHDKDKCYHIPTAEQIVGWLEELTDIMVISINMDIFGTWFYCVETEHNYFENNRFKSRKEATLAAIDATLEYLEKKKL